MKSDLIAKDNSIISIKRNDVLDSWDPPFLSPGDNQELEEITHPHRRRVFLNSRKLLQSLCEEKSISYKGLIKNEFGKPFLVENSDHHCSISHSEVFSVAMISSEICGVDVELIRDKIARVFQKYSDPNELPEPKGLREKTAVWGIKEAVFKASKESGIQFKEHMKILQWDTEKEYAILDFLHHNHKGRFMANYKEVDNHILAFLELVEQP